MLSKKITNMAAFCIAMLFAISTLCAATTLPENLELNTPEYEKHTKGLVIFSHKKHITNYSITCGECHHDNDNNPIDLKEGDSVDRCIACHSETGKKPKEEKLTKKESIKKYHKTALHANCKECHKQFNKKNKLNKGDKGAAPQDCKECHPKK